jgi:YD repeat-containing protein
VVTERELSRTYLPFKKWDDIGLIAEEKMAKSTGGNEFDVQVTYDLYDGKGNVLQITTKDGIVTSYLWGYNQQYPIAKVIGATYEQAIGFVDMSVINNPNVSDNALRTELAKIRNGLVSSNAMVSTYTYAPLIGMTSETDPNGRTTYYEYDPFGRLMHLRDSKNNILKKYCYNYAGQPITCYDGNFTNSDAYSQSFTKNNCGVGMQGTSVLFQVPAGSVSSSISVADANAKAQQKLQQDGQAYANANGTCSPAPIYAVLSIENQSSSWYSTYGDVIIRFYSDAAHTIPVSVTNQSITIQMEYSDLFNGTGDIQEFSFIANGPDFMAFAGVELSSYDGYYTNWWKYFSLISAPGCLIQ